MELDIREIDRKLLPPTDVAAQIQKLEEELIVERDRNLRTLADFKNYRRRIERDGNKIAEESKRAMVLPLLEIIDDMEKALQFAEETKQPSVKGVRIIHKKFLALLEKQGILPFISVDARSIIICMKLWQWRNITVVHREPSSMNCVAVISGITNYCAMRKYQLQNDARKNNFNAASVDAKEIFGKQIKSHP